MTLILLPVFIKFFGVMGIAYEFVLTGVLFALERYFFVRKLIPYFKIKISDIFSIDDYDKVILDRLKSFFYKNILRRDEKIS